MSQVHTIPAVSLCTEVVAKGVGQPHLTRRKQELSSFQASIHATFKSVSNNFFLLEIVDGILFANIALFVAKARAFIMTLSSMSCFHLYTSC